MKITLQTHINDILEQVPGTENIWLEGMVKAEIEYSVTWSSDGAEVEIDNIDISWPEQDDFSVWKMIRDNAYAEARWMFEYDFWEMFKNGQLDVGKKGDEI